MHTERHSSRKNPSRTKQYDVCSLEEKYFRKFTSHGISGRAGRGNRPMNGIEWKTRGNCIPDLASLTSPWLLSLRRAPPPHQPLPPHLSTRGGTRCTPAPWGINIPRFSGTPFPPSVAARLSRGGKNSLRRTQGLKSNVQDRIELSAGWFPIIEPSSSMDGWMLRGMDVAVQIIRDPSRLKVKSTANSYAGINFRAPLSLPSPKKNRPRSVSGSYNSSVTSVDLRLALYVDFTKGMKERERERGGGRGGKGSAFYG